MKLLQTLTIAMLAVLTACNQVDYEPIPVNTLLGEKIDSTYSIARFKNEFLPATGLFSAVKIDTQFDVVINGIITSTDAEGNVYKYMTVQEEVPNGEALKISVDVSGLSGIYPLGQRVSVILNDLYIGKYAESPQVGVYYNNISRTPSRVEPGRMPKLFSDMHIIAYGMPDPAAIVADTMTIAQIKAAGPKVFNKLVCIKNAYFTGKGANFGAPSTIPLVDQIFAPSTNGVGYPQSREIQDGTGSVFVSTSEYAKFATKRLPASSIKGNITAIIGWYNDRDTPPQSNRIYHQLTLRSLKDLGKGYETYHAQN